MIWLASSAKRMLHCVFINVTAVQIYSCTQTFTQTNALPIPYVRECGAWTRITIELNIITQTPHTLIIIESLHWIQFNHNREISERDEFKSHLKIIIILIKICKPSNDQRACCGQTSISIAVEVRLHISKENLEQTTFWLCSECH